MTTTATETMTIGKQLVELCREGKNVDAIKTLYGPDIVSVEAVGGPVPFTTLRGHELKPIW